MKVLIALDETTTTERIVEFIHSNHWLQEAEVKVTYAVVPVVCGPALSPYAAFPETAMEEVYNYGESVLRAACKRLKTELGKEVEWSIPLGDAVHSIIDEARDWQADLIVMGTHSPRGLQKFLCGSVSQAVAASAPCSVLILKVEQEPATASK